MAELGTLPVVALSPPAAPPTLAGPARDILLPYFRATRRPIPTWSRDCHVRLSAVAETTAPASAERCHGLIEVVNEIALIDVHDGRADWARQLCDASIALTHRVVARTGRLDVARHAVQPYINAARLLRLEGRYAEALWHFEQLHGLSSGRPVQIGELCLGEDHRRAIRSVHAGFDDQLIGNFVFDSALTFLKANWYREGMDFERQHQHRVAALSLDILRELGLVSAFYAGEIGRACEGADLILHAAPLERVPVFGVRRLEMMLASRDDAGALQLGRAVTRLVLNWKGRGCNLRLMIALARVLIALDLPNAEIVVDHCLDQAGVQDDVMFRRECLALRRTILLQSGPAAPAAVLAHGYGVLTIGDSDAGSVRQLHDRAMSMLEAD